MSLPSLGRNIISKVCFFIVVQSHTPTLYAFVWRVAECASLNITNGSTSPTGTQAVGNTANVTCADGFKIAEQDNNDYISETLTCEKNGYWNDRISCQLKGKRFALVISFVCCFFIHLENSNGSNIRFAKKYFYIQWSNTGACEIWGKSLFL